MRHKKAGLGLRLRKKKLGEYSSPYREVGISAQIVRASKAGVIGRRKRKRA